jgi:hypothetical protein
LQACSELAVTDGATMTNPRAPSSAAEVVALYQDAM